MENKSKGMIVVFEDNLSSTAKSFIETHYEGTYKNGPIDVVEFLFNKNSMEVLGHVDLGDKRIDDELYRELGYQFCQEFVNLALEEMASIFNGRLYSDGDRVEVNPDFKEIKELLLIAVYYIEQILYVDEITTLSSSEVNFIRENGVREFIVRERALEMEKPAEERSEIFKLTKDNKKTIAILEGLQEAFHK